MERGGKPNPLTNHSHTSSGLPTNAGPPNEANSIALPTTHAHHICPTCSGINIFAAVRDGGSMLRCGDCGSAAGTWKNPLHKRWNKKRPTR